MNEPHYGHAGTVYGGYMYISGKWYISNKEARVMLCVVSLQTYFQLDHPQSISRQITSYKIQVTSSDTLPQKTP